LLSRVNLIRLLKLLREKAKKLFPVSHQRYYFEAKTIAKPVIARSAATKWSLFVADAARRGDLIPILLDYPSLGRYLFEEIASTSLPRKDTFNNVIWRRESIMLSKINLILNT